MTQELSDEEVFGVANPSRGIRNSNPLNLKTQGTAGQDGPFAVYHTPEEGRAAADANLQAYHRKHGINTISGVVSRWAPPTENDTPAYIARVAQQTGLDPNQPLDMEDPAVRGKLLDAMQAHETGQPAPAAAPVHEMSDEEVFGSPPAAPASMNGSSHNGGVTVQVGALPKPRPVQPQHVSEAAGFLDGFAKPYGNIGDWVTGGLEKLGVDTSGFHAVSQRMKATEARARAADPRMSGTPGKIGEFLGNIGGTAPLSFLPGGAGLQGAASGALLTDAKDFKGVARDAAIGAVAGKAAQKAVGAVGGVVSNALSKTPKIMSLPELETAVKDAYGKVDASGFTIPVAHMKNLASGIVADIRDKGGPKAARLFPDSDAFAHRLDALAKQKGGVTISQLDTLRSDIYDALIKPGGKEAGLGKAMRAKIDGLIDSVPNGDVKAARELYMRLSKMRKVTNTLDSADLRKSAAYSGANTDNTIRQQVRPLVDPTSGKRIANATPDEQAALRKVVEGTPLQNLSRLTGQGLDPRKLLGKLSGLGALGTAGTTGGLSLVGPALGLVGTTVSNRASQANLEALLKLIAVGGSKQALKRTPTAASLAATQAAAKAAPVAGLIGGTLAAQARSGR